MLSQRRTIGDELRGARRWMGYQLTNVRGPGSHLVDLSSRRCQRRVKRGAEVKCTRRAKRLDDGRQRLSESLHDARLKIGCTVLYLPRVRARLGVSDRIAKATQNAL